jgi:hypothetical protein
MHGAVAFFIDSSEKGTLGGGDGAGDCGGGAGVSCARRMTLAEPYNRANATTNEILGSK